MLPLPLEPPAGARLSILAIGAHPDDIEIGAGGLLLQLAGGRPRVHCLVLTGSQERHREASNAARAFNPEAELGVELFDLPEGNLPGAWSSVKEILETVARSFSPDLVVAPGAGDAHQDHRTIGEIVPTVFRDHLCLAYEVPKWDGDMPRPNMYFPLTEQAARRKAELLDRHYPSQRARDWWGEETFLALARLRGMECRSRYAEAFTCSKLTVSSGDSMPIAHMGTGVPIASQGS